MRIVAFIIGLLLALASPCFAADDGFVPLFNGKDLSNFEQHGGKAKYAIAKDDDGNPIILGETVPNTPNSFLCTKREYGDFILEYEFKVDEEMNSGVQIRSRFYAQETKLPAVIKGNLTMRTFPADRVHGYQVEIDPDMKRARLWTAGIYDEGRRGWLAPMDNNAAAQKAFKPGAWNHIKVEAIGDHIRTWLNGVPAADLVDPIDQSGLIALQVHGIGNKQEGPFHVAWRNLKIKDLGAQVWKPLFNGKSLDGWTPTVEGTWSVKDGAIVGKSDASEKRHSILLSNDKYKDFTLRVVYKAIKGNSGVYFRVDKVGSGVSVHGFQAEIDPTKDAGGLYETGGRAWVVHPTPEQVSTWYAPGEWNEMTVSAHGGRIVVHVNGYKTAELMDDPGRKEGYLGLQLHGGMDMDVMFKSVEMLESKAP